MNRQTSQKNADELPGLLQAVLKNPHLRQQFGRIAADEKTIAISGTDGADFSDLQWQIGEMDSASFETIELPDEAPDPAAHPVDQGFVPLRRVGTLGDQSCDIDYRIVGKLGIGGTGVVYQAHQRAVDREVAIKVLRVELAVNELSRQRFLTEARVIGGLDHPNVIALHEVCADESGGLFYSMKRIDGTSWEKQISGMTQVQNVATLLRVADAIRYAHSRGLIHRDIKPENVMLGKFGEVLLADWGLAISYSGEQSDAGIHHSIGGTPAYMAPELASGTQGSITYRTDVYLLGATLFQVLTGFPPHAGKSLLECIHAAAHNEIRETQVEGELFDIAIKAMATDPSDRYQSVEEFVAAIEEQRQHEQSERLVRRACKRLAEAGEQDKYEDFRVADALLAEAIDVWPENARALQTRKQVQLDFAKAATARGDLDLAILIYEAAGEADSEAARRVLLQRQRRDATQQEVSRYSTLFTHSPEAGLLIQIATSKIVEANQMFGKLLGYAEDQVVGKPIGELNLWACQERRLALVSELDRTGAIDDFEAQFVHTDGHLVDVLVSGRVVELHGEQMLVSAIRDISLRKQAENELKRSRKRLCDLQRLAGLATWSYDVKTGAVSWSDETFNLLGRRVDQGALSRDEYFDLVHIEDRPKLEHALQRAVESGDAYEVLIRQRGGDQVYRQVLVRGQPICDEDGKIEEVYGVLIPPAS